MYSNNKRKMSFSVPVAHCFTRGVINHQDCVTGDSAIAAMQGFCLFVLRRKGKKNPDYYLAPKIGFLELYEILPGIGCESLIGLAAPRQTQRQVGIPGPNRGKSHAEGSAAGPGVLQLPDPPAHAPVQSSTPSAGRIRARGAHHMAAGSPTGQGELMGQLAAAAIPSCGLLFLLSKWFSLNSTEN